VAQNLRLHFSRKLQKKSFFAFFSQKACSRFDPKKGFKFQSSFNASQLQNAKKFCLFSLLPWKRARKSGPAHLFAALSRAHRSTRKKFCARAKRFAKYNCSN
jgi:hypothetical protein